MLVRIVRIVAVGGLLSWHLYGQTAPDNVGAGKAEDLYWIVDSNDAISYRSKPGGEERALSARFNPLRPSDEVYCKVAVASVPRRGVASTCSLTYETADVKSPLTDKIPPNRWVLLSSIKDVPRPTHLVASSRELLEEMSKRTQRAGLSKGSGCTGDLPVVAPACRDTIDLNDFTVEWTTPPGGGTFASLFLDTIDEFQPRSMRLDRIPLSAHRYEDPRLKRFFEDVQKDSAPTNVVLRLSQSQGVEATRIVMIPSRIEQEGFHEELQRVNAQQSLFRNIALLSVYVNFGLWSKAGKQARELLALAPDEEFVKTYALIGFCQSGYSREAEELRTSLKRLGITDICPAGQK